jgi:hypothetical protein
MPELSKFADMSNRTFNEDEIVTMGNDILFTLQFNMTFPTSLSFLETYI